jgi:hypothetical protein
MTAFSKSILKRLLKNFTKFTQIGIFGFENIPSGNHALDLSGIKLRLKNAKKREQRKETRVATQPYESLRGKKSILSEMFCKQEQQDQVQCQAVRRKIGANFFIIRKFVFLSNAKEQRATL